MITKLRHLWFLISASLVGISVVLMLVFGFNLGLDFTGGARWVVQFEETAIENPVEEVETETSSEVEMVEEDLEEKTAVTQEKLLSFLSTLELEQEPKVQATDQGTFLITLQDMSDEELQLIADQMGEEVGTFTAESYRKVDSTIGASFKKKAFWAIFAALIGIIFFVAWAFRKIPESVNPWRFGGVAIAALFHDVIIVTGIFVVMGALVDVELDLPFVTALLATLGFSVNDTIVILDRVRENIRLQKPTETFEDTIQKSIMQTLFRSINTSISTLLPLVALLFFGADSIFWFVLALTIGILIGTYSSIFLAAPLLVTWKEWSDRRE